MAYCLSVAGWGTITAAELQRQLGVAYNAGFEGAMAHIQAIERLCCRGMQYSGQDFDVLSAAEGFLGHMRYLQARDAGLVGVDSGPCP